MEINKQEFIGKYLDKHMKNHNLPMGMQYYALLGDTEEKAKKAYKAKLKKLSKDGENNKSNISKSEGIRKKTKRKTTKNTY